MIPLFLIDLLKEEYPDSFESILKGYKLKRISSFRINTLKISLDGIENYLKELDGIITKYPPVEGVYLFDEVYSNKITSSNIYKEGLIYLQSLASMLPVIYLDPKEGEDILDMCAAPGSKLSFIQARAHGLANLVGVEIDKIRYERLKKNMENLGVGRISLLNQDALKLDDFFRFDKILLDAPCSGSGIYKEEKAQPISKKLVDNSSALQKKLIKKAYGLLKEGGVMIYSTCSILRNENEENLKYALSLGFKQEKIEDFLNIKNYGGDAVKYLPSSDIDGFYIVKLRK